MVLPLKLNGMAKDIVCEGCAFNYSKRLGARVPVVKTFNACPYCGVFMPWTRRTVSNYFKLLGVARTLPDVAPLVEKSELVAAVRDATITLEELVRRKSGLTARGADLMDQAFRFEYDRATNRIIRMPKIRLNNLQTETKRNEQDGIRLLAMGLMRGVRNIFAHSGGTRKFYYCLNILTTVDLICRQIIGDDGTIAEDRTTFRVMIPKEHRGHTYGELQRYSRGRTANFYCNDCAQNFRARLQVVIHD